jgi:hypothetical protein
MKLRGVDWDAQGQAKGTSFPASMNIIVGHKSKPGGHKTTGPGLYMTLLTSFVCQLLHAGLSIIVWMFMLAGKLVPFAWPCASQSTPLSFIPV